MNKWIGIFKGTNELVTNCNQLKRLAENGFQAEEAGRFTWRLRRDKLSPCRYWNVLKGRLKENGNQLVSETNQLKVLQFVVL
jgi:hypothetical protein